MRSRRSAAESALLACLVLTSTAVHSQEKPKRLSSWLLEQSPAAEHYPAGLSWRVPDEEASQELLRHELLESLSAQPSLAGLRNWIRTLPVTGRVPVVMADARWLIAHPNRDPVLLPGHAVLLPQRPRSVTVITDQGERCAVRHASA